jgi:predicted carbohydrate-binding protein with CBM5 and CBM33 domain
MGDPMKRRSKDSGEPANARSPKAAKLKRRNEATRSTSSAAVKDGEVARLTRELKEALEQQSATAWCEGRVCTVAGNTQSVITPACATLLSFAQSPYTMCFRVA